MLSEATELAARSEMTNRELQVFTGVAVSLTLCCPVVNCFLVPLWEAIRTCKRGRVGATPVITEALQQFTEENLNMWVKVGRWRPDAHVRVDCFQPM